MNETAIKQEINGRWRMQERERKKQQINLL